MKKNNGTIKQFFTTNFIWMLGVGFAIVNLWIAGTISPLKSDIRVLADTVDRNQEAIEQLIDLQTQSALNTQQIDMLITNSQEIKVLIKELDRKVDTHILR